MALITKEDLRIEIDDTGEDNDEVLSVMANAIVSVFEMLTRRTLEATAQTEYYNSPECNDRIFLKNWPVAASPAMQLWDDPDWQWPTASLIPATEYRVDQANGVVYYNAYFSTGKQSLKVSYTAGYSTVTFPAGMKQIFVRQAAHWYKQAKDQKWDMTSISQPAGAGTTSYKDLVDNFLPDFAMLVERERMKW